MFKITPKEKQYILRHRVLSAYKVLGVAPASIKVTNPGVLEVPKNKKVTSLTKKHVLSLIQKKGKPAISRAIQNLLRWNKNKRTANANAIRAWATKAAKWLKEA